MLVQIQSPDNVLNGKVTVTTAGTRVPIGTANCLSVTIKALSTNTGIIYVGNSAVSSANGHQLSARDSASIDISTLGSIWIDASVSGEGVTYLAVI